MASTSTPCAEGAGGGLAPLPERRAWRIEGRVQGVAFRESTRTEALRIGQLAGAVRNLPDGAVQCEASGSRARLDALERWLERGPALARVDALRRLDGTSGPLPQPFAVLR